LYKDELDLSGQLSSDVVIIFFNGTDGMLSGSSEESESEDYGSKNKFGSYQY
jgi:hypothetical protein